MRWSQTAATINAMKDRSLSPMEKTAREIATRLRESGHIAYFAGGCVRDIVRGQVPKDFDIATDAKPEVVQKLFSRTCAVGAHFGVILVVENGFQFEVATFRSDEAYIDGRHPSAVHFSSPEEDAKRRDFTINGMFYDPVAEHLLDSSGLMRAILPELDRMKGVLQPEQFHPEGDVFKHTRLMLQFLPEKVYVPLIFAVLLHDVA